MISFHCSVCKKKMKKKLDLDFDGLESFNELKKFVMSQKWHIWRSEETQTNRVFCPDCWEKRNK